MPPCKLAIEGETEGPAMVRMGQEYLNGPISFYCKRWKAKGEKSFDLDGEEAFLDWDYGHFEKADLLSRFSRPIARRSAGRGCHRTRSAVARECPMCPVATACCRR